MSEGEGDGSETPVKPPISSRGRIFGEVVAALVALVLFVWVVRANDVWLERHMTLMYCVSDQAQLAPLHVLRGVGLALSLFVVVSVRPRLGRWFGRYFAKRSPVDFAKSSGSILFAIVLAFVVTDGYLRFTRSRAVYTPPPPPNLGETMTLDKAGFRLARPDETLDPERDTLVFNGESVAFGYGLPDDATIPVQVGKLTGMQVRNIARSGTANDEGFMVLEAELPKIPKPKAVVTFVVFNWLYRNIGLHRDHLVLGADGRLVVAPALPEWLWRSPLFDKLRALYHEADPIEIVRVVLQRTAEVVRARGAYPLMVFTQCGDECIANGPRGPRILQRLVEGQTFDWIHVEQGGKALRLETDYHPNRAGAARYAEAIEKALRAKGVVEK